MDLSNYLCEDEITQLNQVFEISLQHDSTLVFWTGISPHLAKDWAHRNDLKTLTMAMGLLYTENNRRSQKATNSWTNYMKGASWVFARHACRDRYAIVLTNAPPNVYSTREHSNYREIEEPVLKGLQAGGHALQIDYVHPTVPGAECFRYQIWPDNRSSDWLTFLENISVKPIVNKIVQYTNLQPSKKIKESKCSTVLNHESAESSSLSHTIAEGGDRKQETTREKKAAKRLKADREQQAARDKKAAKRRKAEREQQAARDRKAAEKAAKRLRAEREQQAARERKAAKRLKVEREQQAAKRLKAEREQQAAKEKKTAKLVKVAKLVKARE